MIIYSISKLDTRLLDTNRTWGATGASRRKLMSIRATHGAAYNGAIVEEADADDSSRLDAPVDEPSEDLLVKDKEVFAYEASSSAIRQVTTRADVEDAYASN